MPYKDEEFGRAYYRAWVKRRQTERRAAYIQERGGACARCGDAENLEIDHVDPTTKELETGSGFWTRSESVRSAELTKCQLLCRTCHQLKSLGEMASRLCHGSGATYWRGCRCPDCTSWRTKHLVKRREDYARKVSRETRLPRKQEMAGSIPAAGSSFVDQA